jgi:energy-coupling factor transporter ATP-binding protein EcfA2
MLTSLNIRNFKRFAEVEIELGNPVVFIGPNNSGKTTALQALALWHYGVTKWNERRGGVKPPPEERPGVTINRKDLIALPVPVANLLWRGVHTHTSVKDDGKVKTRNVYIDLTVSGASSTGVWTCGFEFYYGNEESIYCRPLRSNGTGQVRMPVPPEATGVRVAFMPAMSGLAAVERRLDPGAIDVLIGEGRTAEVLRNLCYRLAETPPSDNWGRFAEEVQRLFGVQLQTPTYIRERGEITMSYREGGAELDLSCAGRGLQQVMLLLAYMYANPGSVLLIDEPDAHLEWLRQRQVYQVLADNAQSQGCQIIAASHSEVLLNEAADRDVVVAFVGRPHRIDDRGAQVVKSLKELGFEQYALAEQNGWVLYLEGSTDLAILRSFAERLGHDARPLLERPFVKYIENRFSVAESHFHGLREGKPDLRAFGLLDRVDRAPASQGAFHWHVWRRREIENYLCQPETLREYAEQSARSDAPGELFEESLGQRRRQLMEECVAEFAPPAALRDRQDQWWTTVKASDDFLDRVFAAFYQRLGLSNLMRKRDYHVLAAHVPVELIDAEVVAVLDAIVNVGRSASPAPLAGP